MKRAIIILLVLGSIIGLTIAAYYFAAPTTEPKRVTEDPNVEIVKVKRETLVDIVNATGSIEPSAEVELNFEISGVVKEVLVKRGQNVMAGTLLARLETDDLELAVTKAQIELAQKQADLQNLLEPEPSEKIATAQARIESARLKLAELVNDPDKEDELTKVAAELRLKEVELKKAQWNYDQVAYRGDIGAMAQADALQEATLSYETVLANYNIAVRDLEATDAELAEARSNLIQAEADLAELLAEPSRSELISRQASVELAKISLEESLRDLEQAVLVSPTAGVVLDAAIEPGERVLQDAQQAALIVADTSAYLLKVEIDEIDIGRIERGQKSAIILDAFVEAELEGEVIDISPRPVQTEGNSIVVYEVTIAVAASPDNPGLLSGMTATANIETRRLPAALVIPTRAIQTDRDPEGVKIYVEKLDGQDEIARVEIELGLRDGDMTEVVAGLEEGDQIIVRNQTDFGPGPNL